MHKAHIANDDAVALHSDTSDLVAQRSVGINELLAYEGIIVVSAVRHRIHSGAISHPLFIGESRHPLKAGVGLDCNGGWHTVRRWSSIMQTLQILHNTVLSGAVGGTYREVSSVLTSRAAMATLFALVIPSVGSFVGNQDKASEMHIHTR